MRRARRGTVGLIALCAALLAVPASAQQKKKPEAAAVPAKAAPADYAKRYAEVCASCHGANGRSDVQGVPVLAGQPSLYAITQLFLFREGRRTNPQMTAVAKTLKDDDLRGFSDFIGTLPPVPPPAPATPPDAERMRQGQALASQHKCVLCHGADLSGGQQVPRIAGQKEEYLRATLHDFKGGQRPGYTRAMIEALSPVPVQDLDPLAYYAARMPVGAAPPR